MTPSVKDRLDTYYSSQLYHDISAAIDGRVVALT